MHHNIKHTLKHVMAFHSMYGWIVVLQRLLDIIKTTLKNLLRVLNGQITIERQKNSKMHSVDLFRIFGSRWISKRRHQQVKIRI